MYGEFWGEKKIFPSQCIMHLTPIFPYCSKSLLNYSSHLLQNEALQSFVLTRSQQKGLFVKTYRRQERETKRLVKKYYKMEWKSIQKKIREVLVALKFRGDLRPYRSYGTMGALKRAVLKNSLLDFKKVISKRSLWRNVPYDRFRRRKLFSNMAE